VDQGLIVANESQDANDDESRSVEHLSIIEAGGALGPQEDDNKI